MVGFGWAAPAALAQYVPGTPSTSGTVTTTSAVLGVSVTQNTATGVSGVTLAQSPRSLSRTGADSASSAAYGAVLVGAGGLTVIAARRRRQALARR